MIAIATVIVYFHLSLILYHLKVILSCQIAKQLGKLSVKKSQIDSIVRFYSVTLYENKVEW